MSGPGDPGDPLVRLTAEDDREELRYSRADLAGLTPTERLPSLGHAVLFFLMMVPLLVGAQYLAIVTAQRMHVFGHRALAAYVELAGSDARLGLPAQAFAYLLVAGCGAWLFRWIWQRPALEGLHWHVGVAARRAGWLVGIGLVCGLGNGVAGALLPMPKDPPILLDMMHSEAGAWMMLLFGITFAPALEETAFRGFLLPGFVHAFDWLVRKGDMRARTRKWVGLPVSIVLTSLPFAFMHAPQVSHAWGPLLLIGMVSVVLCVVRLALDSLAASMLVHAAYNLTLFAGILVETGGFRHLERLAG
ncbi:MAG TPA: CPBP family intramembrane glutamic endopeptidase [Acidobacteriaceae bacterium]